MPEKELKIGVVSKYLLPALVFIEPSLTRGLPKPIADATGMDALHIHYNSISLIKPNLISDMFALEGIRLISENIVVAYINGSAMEAREKMLVASIYGGMALTAAGTAAGTIH